MLACSRGQEEPPQPPSPFVRKGILENKRKLGGGEFQPLLQVNAHSLCIFKAFLSFTVGFCITTDASLALVTHNSDCSTEVLHF